MSHIPYKERIVLPEKFTSESILKRSPLQETVSLLYTKAILNVDSDSINSAPPQKKANMRRSSVRVVITRGLEPGSFRNVESVLSPVGYECFTWPSQEAFEDQIEALFSGFADWCVIEMASFVNSQTAWQHSSYIMHAFPRPIILSCFSLMSIWTVFGIPSGFAPHKICSRCSENLESNLR